MLRWDSRERGASGDADIQNMGGGSHRLSCTVNHVKINTPTPPPSLLRHVAVNLPSESSSSSSASFSRTSAGRVTATAGVGSNIIVSNPVEVLSAMVVKKIKMK